MTYQRKQLWRGAPQPVTPEDNRFMQNILSGVRRIREQATNRKAAPDKNRGITENGKVHTRTIRQ